VAEILIIGAGIAGLGAALGLEAQGNTVTIIEQDPPAPTTSGDAAFEMWDRRNVPQFRQAHGFSARSRTLLLKYAPGVVARLAADGIVESNAFKLVAPPEIHEPDDDAFTGFMTRRPAFELALRLEAEDRPRIGFMCPETVSGQDLTGTSYTASSGLVLPNRVCNPNSGANVHSQLRWFNTSCFTNPAFGVWGNSALGAVTDPGINNWNISTAKRFPLAFIREGHALELRSDFLNAWNHTQWQSSDKSMTSATYGRITSTRPARQIQFALRYLF